MTLLRLSRALLCGGFIMLLLAPGLRARAQFDEFCEQRDAEEAPVVAKELKPRRAPRRAIRLFDGKSLDAWTHRGSNSPCAWKTTPDGALIVTAGFPDIITKEKFRDFQLHVEFKIPLMPNAHGQARGNSGVYLHGLYEIQVLDAYNNETYKAGGCGSIYEQKDPDENACKPPEHWQEYDIKFRAPRFDSKGVMTEKPRVTVVWNGVLVHDDVEILHPTRASLEGPMTPTGPIMLQNHGAPVQFRNVWLVPKKSR